MLCRDEHGIRLSPDGIVNEAKARKTNTHATRSATKSITLSVMSSWPAGRNPLRLLSNSIIRGSKKTYYQNHQALCTSADMLPYHGCNDCFVISSEAVLDGMPAGMANHEIIQIQRNVGL